MHLSMVRYLKSTCKILRKSLGTKPTRMTGELMRCRSQIKLSRAQVGAGSPRSPGCLILPTAVKNICQNAKLPAASRFTDPLPANGILIISVTATAISSAASRRPGPALSSAVACLFLCRPRNLWIDAATAARKAARIRCPRLVS